MPVFFCAAGGKEGVVVFLFFGIWVLVKEKYLLGRKCNNV